MTISGVNNLISFQESQLIHMLQQQPSRAKTEAGAENRRAWLAAGGQNLPGAEKVSSDVPDSKETSGPPTTAWEPIDPDLSPENINALLLAMQTHQASLDTIALVGSSTSGPGGRTLVDYLTAPDTVINDAANENIHTQNATSA